MHLVFMYIYPTGLPSGLGSSRQRLPTFLKVGCVASAYFCTSGAYDVSYAAFTLNDFDDQERNLTFVKTDF